jgi:DNA-binding CsgD family transcriptional regulator
MTRAPVILLGPDGAIVEAGAGVRQLLRIDDHAPTLGPLHQRVIDPLTNQPLGDASLPWSRALAGQVVDWVDLRIRSDTDTADDGRWVSVAARPVLDPGLPSVGALVVVVPTAPAALGHGANQSLPPYLQRVLLLLGRGYSNAEIAAELHLSLATVRLYVKRLLLRLGVKSRTQAALHAVRIGLVSPDEVGAI